MIDFYKQINEVAKNLPELPKRPKKNFFDILGVERKETINSKMLAYFFDPNEEHGFGTLFFDCLLRVLSEKSNCDRFIQDFSEPFEIAIEVATSSADSPEDRLKRIDLLITGSQWSIIIENKLFHHLANPLDVYEQHVINDKKIRKEDITGIILSLDTKSEVACKVHETQFFNVTHQELINKVQQHLILTDIENDIDIFYLREYAKTINSHYKNKMNEPMSDKIVASLIEQKEAVNNIIKKRTASINYIDEKIIEVFAEKGYRYEKGWYYDPKYKNIRFFITPTEVILETNSIGIAYELWDDSLSKVGIENIKLIQEKLINPEEGRFDISAKHDKGNTMKRVVTYRDENFLSHKEDTIKGKLGAILDNHFFNDGGVIQNVQCYLPETLQATTTEDN
ncbi:Hypothetical protein I595_2779 [Croceitalea dokdonensis DOKDO 023]|uniref:PD-(D/E)XK nuclease superfamily protein n=1 Tax=Croceitalea dokdonensis DOKDO 023 TaxID=1300341 RepID=A0A0P7AIC5_9FLAO|nr:PD-(D/E)XK nuclease family protein [Croceitalea dokdonensis]KPM31512.1 Hypothetical protein I595_2779 [Croceitalea dokdonensis DOKDO 023]